MTSNVEPISQTMVLICAWCWPEVEQFFATHPQHRGKIVSHGMCPDCETRFRSYMERKMAETYGHSNSAL